MEDYSILKLGKTLEEKSLIKDLISSIIPEWGEVNANEIICERTNGLTNISFIISVPPSEPSILPNPIFLRIFKEYTTGIIEREVERAIFKVISEAKLGPKLLGDRDKYRIEEYIHGTPLTHLQVHNEIYLRAFGDKICHFNYSHNLEDCLFALYPARKPKIIKLLDTWVHKFKLNYSNYLLKLKDPRNIQILQDYEFICKEEFYTEAMKILPKDLENISVLPTHNDIHENNIICHRRNPEKIELVDFEYTDYNYRGVDLACYAEECAMDYTYSEFPYITYNPQNTLTDNELDIMLSSYLYCYYTNYKIIPTLEERQKRINEELPKFREEVRRFECIFQIIDGLWGWLAIEWDHPQFNEKNYWHFLYSNYKLEGYISRGHREY